MEPVDPNVDQAAYGSVASNANMDISSLFVIILWFMIGPMGILLCLSSLSDLLSWRLFGNNNNLIIYSDYCLYEEWKFPLYSFLSLLGLCCSIEFTFYPMALISTLRDMGWGKITLFLLLHIGLVLVLWTFILLSIFIMAKIGKVKRKWSASGLFGGGGGSSSGLHQMFSILVALILALGISSIFRFFMQP
ncbi:MAG TPA: hypothetical protein VKU00_17290 [Chthonomonadaceae bacterium]|nr:hypothetical protein [Chthonomonadaceae bacterium]